MKIVSGKWDEVIQIEASDWVVLLHEGKLSGAQRVEFLSWLRRSPAHVDEFITTEMTWAALSDHATSFDDEISALLHEAQGDQGNVVSLSPVLMQQPETTPKDARRSGHFSAYWYAAAAVLVSLAVLTSYFTLGDRMQHYVTAVGEQRRVELSDGSIIELNTASALSVKMERSQRIVQLESGEAFFIVAKDASRPFRVLSHTAMVQAVGTEFDVYRQADYTTVGVLEGKVTVTPRVPDSKTDASDGSARAIKLEAGESVKVKPIGIPTVESRAEQLSAWRQHRLIFDNERLETVAAEFNRYNAQQIIIADSKLADQRISGVFDANKPQGLVRFLTSQGSLQVSAVNEKQQILTIVR